MAFIDSRKLDLLLGSETIHIPDMSHGSFELKTFSGKSKSFLKIDALM